MKRTSFTFKRHLKEETETLGVAVSEFKKKKNCNIGDSHVFDMIESSCHGN